MAKERAWSHQTCAKQAAVHLIPKAFVGGQPAVAASADLGLSAEAEVRTPVGVGVGSKSSISGSGSSGGGVRAPLTCPPTGNK